MTEKPEREIAVLGELLTMSMDQAIEAEIVSYLEKPFQPIYLDGCKVYSPDDSFVVFRFNGTEPLLRVFTKAHTQVKAGTYIAARKKMLSL